MKSFFTSMTSFVIVCCLLATGCHTNAKINSIASTFPGFSRLSSAPAPSTSSPPTTSSFRMPGATRTPNVPGNAGAPTIPGTQTPAMPGGKSSPIPATGQQVTQTTVTPPGAITQGAITQGAIAQVGYFQPQLCGVNGGAGCAVPVGPVLQGQPIRQMLGHNKGCQCCNDSYGPPVFCAEPMVEFAPQGWNLYGVDPQEFICDGGDHPPAARVMKNDTISGMAPEDTVVHYTTGAGDINVQASNRTCVYSPRFNSIRRISGSVEGEKVLGLSQVDRPVGPERFEKDLPGLVMRESAELGHADVAKRIDALRDRNRGVPVEGDLAPIERNSVIEMLVALSMLEPATLEDEQLALIQEGMTAAVRWTLTESVEVAVEDLKAPVLTRDQKLDAFTVYDFPDAGRLKIIKMADKSHAQSGEEVTFVITVQNVGDSTVNNIVIADNLVTRLAYVADSQECDREAEFTAEENAEVSHRLEWKLKEELAVGETAQVKFRCKLR